VGGWVGMGEVRSHMFSVFNDQFGIRRVHLTEGEVQGIGHAGEGLQER
jgi:hypothetical protein